MHRLILWVVLGVALSTSLAAQPTQVWQRQFGEAPATNVIVNRLLQVRPTRLVGVGSAIQRVGSTNLYNAGFWRFNAQGDTLSSRWYFMGSYGSYQNALPLAGGDYLLTAPPIPPPWRAPSTRVCFTCAPIRWAPGVIGYGTCPSTVASGGRRPCCPCHLTGPCGRIRFCCSPPRPGNPAGLGGAQVVRLDSLQRVVWQRQYAGNTANANSLNVSAMAPLLDGSYLLIGLKGRAYQPPAGSSFVVSSGWMQRIKANGDTIALPEYFGNIYELYEPQSVQGTADGGFIVAGSVYPDKYVPVFNCCPASLGWLAKFDSLGVMQWEQRIQGRNSSITTGAGLNNVQVLANGQYVVSGLRGNASLAVYDEYLAVYASTLSGAFPIWEYYVPRTNPNTIAFAQPTAVQADGSLTLAGQTRISTSSGGVSETRYPGLLTRFTGVGAPMVLNYCQRPPVPNAGYALNPGRDTLTLVDFSAGGPRFALVEPLALALPRRQLLRGAHSAPAPFCAGTRRWGRRHAHGD